LRAGIPIEAGTWALVKRAADRFHVQLPGE